MSHAASQGTPTNELADPTSRNRSSSPDAPPTLDPLPPTDALTSVYSPIKNELAGIDAILKLELQRDTPWVNRLMEQNWIGGGKRIRPVFLLLSGAAAGELHSGHQQLAAAIEMVHAATLIHDDVLDEAETRRHLPTVNATWDNRTSVLLGDFLFSHAFYIASLAGNSTVVRILAQSTAKVCEGEIRQNAWVGNFDLSEEDYLAMIADKTGELCSCSCRIGALLSGADDKAAAPYARYGHNLGVAFQIIDDVLDLVGHPDEVGKTLGTDLINQKPTLPIIHGLKNSTGADYDRLRELLESKTVHVDHVLPCLLKTDSVQYARDVAQSHASEALQFAESLPPTPYSQSLEQLAHFVLSRVH